MNNHKKQKNIFLISTIYLILSISIVSAQTLFKVENNHKCGYMDSTGKEVIPLSYYSCDDTFSEGLAGVVSLVKADKKPDWVIDGVSYKNAAGYIDPKGNEVIKPDIRWFGTHPFCNGFAVIDLANEKGHMIIKKDGSYLTKTVFQECRDYSEGFFAVKIKKKWGFVNRTGSICIKPVFEEVESFHDGLAVVSVNGKYGFIDTTGKIACEPVFAYATSFKNGYAIVACDTTDKNNKILSTDELKKWCILERKTLTLLPFSFDDFKTCYIENDFFSGNSNNTGIAFNSKGDTLFVLDEILFNLKTEKIVKSYDSDSEVYIFKKHYTFRYPFSENYAIATVSLPSPHAPVYAIINRDGKIIREDAEIIPNASPGDFAHSKTITTCAANLPITQNNSQYLVFDPEADYAKCWIIKSDGSPICTVEKGMFDDLSSVSQGLYCLKKSISRGTQIQYYTIEGVSIWPPNAQDN